MSLRPDAGPRLVGCLGVLLCMAAVMLVLRWLVNDVIGW